MQIHMLSAAANPAKSRGDIPRGNHTWRSGKPAAHRHSFNETKWATPLRTRRKAVLMLFLTDILKLVQSLSTDEYLKQVKHVRVNRSITNNMLYCVTRCVEENPTNITRSHELIQRERIYSWEFTYAPKMRCHLKAFFFSFLSEMLSIFFQLFLILHANILSPCAQSSFQVQFGFLIHFCLFSGTMERKTAWAMDAAVDDLCLSCPTKTIHTFITFVTKCNQCSRYVFIHTYISILSSLYDIFVVYIFFSDIIIVTLWASQSCSWKVRTISSWFPEESLCAPAVCVWGIKKM